MNRQSFANQLNRRNFLKGVSASLILPAFQSMLPGNLLAAKNLRQVATSSTGAPLRAAYIFFPNGSIPDLWWPQGKGNDFSFKDTLKPLESVRDSVQVLSGLDQLNATAGKDGGGDHARGNSVFLTSVRIKKSATDFRAGISIDQAIASEVGCMTRFPSLELSCDPARRAGACDTGYSCAYQYNLSWKTPTNPMTPESNPRKVFERLFGEGAHGERTEQTKQRMANRRSILDFVMTDAQRMQKNLDHRDREKLDQYLTGIREVESRIENLERFGSTVDPDIATPDGIPFSHGEHIDIMFDMMLLAFQTDSTRIATLMLAHDGDNRSHDEIGIPEGHHELTHHQNKADRIAKVGRIDQWYVKKFASFLTRLDGIDDIDGQSMLHNSMILYGSGNADGNKHTHDNLPLVLAGHGGGNLNPGNYRQFGSKPAANLFLNMADNMGVQNLPRFGDSTGRLTSI
ncbi:MAG: DUF1552 domain-containing protein [Opitutales bacterium]|jgi:hypothetical protein|nr:DUF1552 domain-containing protein [Opitutales bacterium]MBT6378585.1 DUF1552 domain-containing protein [Opitutales bacterium]